MKERGRRGREGKEVRVMMEGEGKKVISDRCGRWTVGRLTFRGSDGAAWNSSMRFQHSNLTCTTNLPMKSSGRGKVVVVVVVVGRSGRV